jgi:hypothetical protein
MFDRATTALDGVGLTLSVVRPGLRRAGAVLAKAGSAARRCAGLGRKPKAGRRRPTSPETTPDVHGDPETPV